MTNPLQFVLSIAGSNGVPVALSTEIGGYVTLTDEINRIVKAFVVGQYRGTVTFLISSSVGDLYWTSIVTFSDDIPTGVWNTTNNHPEN